MAQEETLAMGKTFSLEVPDSLLKEFDEAIQSHYASRSEAIRSAMKQLIDTLSKRKR